MSGLSDRTAPMDVLAKNIHWCYKTTMNKLAKILILAGILVGLFALGRGLYYSPNKDSGLPVDSASQGAAVSSAGLSQYPERLLIPKLGIDTNVQHVGVTKNGNMAAPDNFTDVSWYKFGTVPGYLGSAVMAGHQNNAMGLDGIFVNLDDLELGDDVYVVDKEGKRLHFRVVDIEVYAYDDPTPLPRIFNTDDSTYLNLITCAGQWLQSAKTNEKRLVIYAKLVR